MAKLYQRVKGESSSKRWFYRSGWFVCLIGLFGVLYLHAIQQKNEVYEEMSLKLRQLEQEKQEALAARDELLLQIQSQSDPAWVEMVLKQNLGMVGEGQVKVYFHNNE